MIHSMITRGYKWVGVAAIVGLFLAFCCGLQPARAAGDDDAVRILFIGGQTNDYTGLRALGYDPEIVPARSESLEELNFFAYQVIVLGNLGDRNILSIEPIQSRLLHAIEEGVVLLGFRSYSGSLTPPQDLWLPSPATKDGVYQAGEILDPHHPIFNDPHSITIDMLRRVHSGVMYNPYVNLGEGWIPLVSGDYLMPFFRNETGVPSYDGEDHYGIMELPYGQGRILLVQMIPEHQWLHNDNGREDSVGRLFMENIVNYAVNSHQNLAYVDPQRPDAYLDGGLGAVLSWTERPATPQMSLDQWETNVAGPYSVKWDDRDIITITHPDVPSHAGQYAQVTRNVSLSAAPQGSTLLTFYLTDDYRGGVERVYEGDARLASETFNWKAEHRFVELVIDGEVVWEEDVLGSGAFPWPGRLHVLDITPWVEGRSSIDLTFRVVDRQGTEDPFWTEVFIARVGLLQGIPSGDGPGVVEAFESGDYLPVIRVSDMPDQRSRVLVRQGDNPLLDISLTADDRLEHWVAADLVHLGAGEPVDVDFAADGTGRGREAIERVYLIPEQYLAKPLPDPVDVRKWFVAAEPVNEIILHVKGPEGVERLAPVSSGIPLSQGAVREEDLHLFELATAAGEKVPLQVRKLAHWPDGSVKWVLLSFIGQPGQYVLFTEGRSSDNPCACQNLVQVIGESRFVVDTGRLRFALDVSGKPQIDDAFIDGRPVALSGADLTMTHKDGRHLSLADSQIKDVRLLENGSERAIIWVRGNFLTEHGPDLEFTLQWRFYKDQPMAWVDVTFTNRLGRMVELSDVRFHLQGSFGSKTDTPNGIPWRVVQPNERDFIEFVGEEEVNAGRRFPGWVTTHDEANPDTLFFTGVRHFWEQYPKSIGVGESEIELGLWAGEAEMLLEVADGFQKTHEIVLGWLDHESGAQDAQELATLLYQPYVATAEASYLVATGALGIFSPPPDEADDYPSYKVNYEQSVDEAYRNYMSKRESRREYGMQNFGDDTFEWGYGPAYTFWSNQEYDHHYGFLLQFLRSQDLRFWQIGDQGARHYRDVDVIHHSTNPHHMGAPRAHNTRRVVDEGWYPDHNRGGVAVHHAWVEGLWLHYLLTGDELTYEAAREASDWFVAEVEADRWYRGTVERGPGWTLIALIGAYRATSDEKYLRAAQEVAEDTYLRQDPVRGLYIKPADGRTSYEGGTAFMSGIFARGMARLYLETGDPRAARSVIYFYDWLTREMRVDETRFLTRSAPGWRTPSDTEQHSSLLAYGLAFLDREEDWPMLLRAINLRANTRSMSWIPEAMAVFEQLYGKYVPMEVVLPGASRIEVGREGPTQAELSLRRLQAVDEVQGVLEFGGLPDGLAVDPPEVVYQLGPGEKAFAVPLRVSVEPTVAPGRYTMVVQDRVNDGPERRLPVEVPGRTLIDRFQRPIENPWFAGFTIKVHEDMSEGWEYIKVGSSDRLRRKDSTDQYIVYDALGLFDFELTFYVPKEVREDVADAIEISMVKVGEEVWETISTTIAWEETSEQGVVKGVMKPTESYFRGDAKLKVTLLAGGDPTAIQLDRFEITGWR